MISDKNDQHLLDWLSRTTIPFRLLVCMALCTAVSAPVPASAQTRPGHSWEDYDQRLSARLHSIDDIISFADSSLGHKDRHTAQYAELLNTIIQKRFYHSYSYYTYKDNWIASLSGRFIWRDLAAVVLPDDIMKYPYAACSQQAIVLKECFKRSGITYRPIRLVGHFAMEALLGGKWYYFDTNIEPRFVKGRKSLSELIFDNELTTVYKGELSEEDVRSVFAVIDYGRMNEPIAWKAMLFHRITFLLSYLLPLILLFFAVRTVTVLRKKTNRTAFPVEHYPS